MKITGAEFKEWHDTAWPKGYIWADESTFDNGRDIYGATGEVQVAASEVFTVPADWGMLMEDGPQHPKDRGDGLSIRSLIKAWRKERDTETIAITLPKVEATAARALMAERGWKVTP